MTDHATLRRMCDAQADVPSALVLELLDQYQDVRDAVRRGALCPMCSTGMTRQTVGMVCQLCGTDYARPEYASMRRDSAQTAKAALADALAVRAERDALRDQYTALEVACRGYRERAERLAAQLDRMKQDAEDDRDEARR